MLLIPEKVVKYFPRVGQMVNCHLVDCRIFRKFYCLTVLWTFPISCESHVASTISNADEVSQSVRQQWHVLCSCRPASPLMRSLVISQTSSDWLSVWHVLFWLGAMNGGRKEGRKGRGTGSVAALFQGKEISCSDIALLAFPEICREICRVHEIG